MNRLPNHHWMEVFDDCLIFVEDTADQLEGLQSNFLIDMHGKPESDREKAFSALMLLKANKVNTMLMGEVGFDVEIRGLEEKPELFHGADFESGNLPPLLATTRPPRRKMPSARLWYGSVRGS